MKTLLLKIQQEKLLAIFAIVIWLFFLMTTISKTYSLFVREGMEIEMAYIVFRAVLIWGIIALFVPLFVWLAKKFPFEGPSYRNIGLHIAFSILIVPVHSVIYRIIMTATYDDILWSWASFLGPLPNIMLWIGMVGPLAYWLVIAVFYFKKYYEEYKKRQLRNSELEAELASIRLHVLKVQLHPHFLFNTLHNINSLMHEDPGTAKNMLTLLKRFLHISINRVDKQKVPLKDELEFTGIYLEIEKTRFNNRLTIQKDIHKETLEALVPSFLLQPLVENAVKHGISQKIDAGVLRIVSKKKNGQLILAVEDNGPGLDENMGSNGIGLDNIRQRLSQLYSDAKFELLSSSLGGLKVNIEIPLN